MEVQEFANFLKTTLGDDVKKVEGQLLNGLVGQDDYKKQTGVYTVLKAVIDALDPLVKTFIEQKLSPDNSVASVD